MGQRVFVVAGDNTVLQHLPAVLNSDLDVSMLQSSNEALWELQQIAPDVLIADNDLPGFSGLDLADLVPNFAPDTRVVLISRKADAELISQANQRGVFQVLDQNPAHDAVVQAVEAALQAQPVARPEPEIVAVAPEPEPEPVVERSAPTRGMAGPPSVSKAPSGIAKGPPQVSKAPQPGAMSKAPQQVSARPLPAPPRAKIAPPPVSARPEPVSRAAPPQVSARPAAQQRVQPPAQQEAPPPSPAPATSDDTGGFKFKKQGGSLVLTAETLAPLVAKLKDLGMQLGAQATILTDRWGVPLVEEGRTSLPLPPFLPLLATSFSTMIDYTRQLHNDHGSGLYMHEGDRYDIYIFDVGKQFLLMMIFDKAIAASKLGSVWLYAKRAVRELADELEGKS